MEYKFWYLAVYLQNRKKVCSLFNVFALLCISNGNHVEKTVKN